MRAVAALMIAVTSACGGGGEEIPADAGPCNTRIVSPAIEDGVHVELGQPITWASNPPASGRHYPAWARWAESYADPIDRGFWVHDLEHGGVVFLYNCPAGCDADVQALEAVVASLPPDERCVPPPEARWIVTPDPLLPPDVKIAAVAWGRIYTAECVDPLGLTRFWTDHLGDAPEDTCAQGQVPVDGPDAGL
jgi:hypothetical protein